MARDLHFSPVQPPFGALYFMKKSNFIQVGLVLASLVISTSSVHASGTGQNQIQQKSFWSTVADVITDPFGSRARDNAKKQEERRKKEEDAAKKALEAQKKETKEAEAAARAAQAQALAESQAVARLRHRLAVANAALAENAANSLDPSVSTNPTQPLDTSDPGVVDTSAPPVDSMIVQNSTKISPAAPSGATNAKLSVSAGKAI